MKVKFKMKIGDGESLKHYSTTLDLPEIDNPEEVDISSVSAAIIQSIQQ